MLLIRGGETIGPSGLRRADVLIGDDGRIADVGEEIEASGAEVVEAGGALVVPGAIDAHTHLDLPVGKVRSADDFESGTIAAACGGTTCVVDFAGAGRESPDEALRDWSAKASGRAAIDYGLHLTVTSMPADPQAASRTFASFLDRGVASVKLYMAYPERLMVDDETLAGALAASAETGVLVCVHAEDGDRIERLTARELDLGHVGPDAHPATRPPDVEADAIRRAAELASEAGAPVYVVHLSSAAGLREVRAANTTGPRVLAETCPQYLYLTEDCLRRPSEEAANFVCSPPLRADVDREALWSGLDDGSVQVLATDHCPFTASDRRRGVFDRDEGWRSFTEIPGGLPGVETRLALGYRGVQEGRMSPARWIDSVAGAPARLFGLSHVKGSLAVGLDGDVVVFDPAARHRLDADRLHMATDHSPYAGMEVTGWPAITISRGAVVARGGEPWDVAPGRGRFVHRHPFGWRHLEPNGR